MTLLCNISVITYRIYNICSDTGTLSFDGWLTYDFTSFSTVLQSYQEVGRVIIKGCVQWNPFAIIKIPASLEPGTARSVVQRLTYWLIILLKGVKLISNIAG